MAAPVGGTGFVGAAADVAKRVVPLRTQISAESTTIATRWAPADSSYFERSSGLSFRAGNDTVRDTIDWMVRAGHLPQRFRD